jgi:hypothetical protein
MYIKSAGCQLINSALHINWQLSDYQVNDLQTVRDSFNFHSFYSNYWVSQCNLFNCWLYVTRSHEHKCNFRSANYNISNASILSIGNEMSCLSVKNDEVSFACLGIFYQISLTGLCRISSIWIFGMSFK